MIRRFCAIAYYGFARWTPTSFAPGGRLWMRLRYAICRRMFASCGKGVNVESGAYFGSGRCVSIGDGSGIGIDAWIDGPCSIGKHVMMGPRVTILTHNHRFDRLDVPMCEQGSEAPRPVTICDDVWIGAGATILPGVTIGSGSIIGAGAVIPKDVPEYAIVVGNPGRIVRYRNAEREVAAR